MRRTRRSLRNLPKHQDTSSDDEPSPKRPTPPNPATIKVNHEVNKERTASSSSESDIETYLQPINKLDLNSSFFNLEKSPQIDKPLEQKIFSGVSQSRLSSSESDEDGQAQTEPTTKLNFQQIHDYTKKLEEARLKVDEYNAKKREQADKVEIFDMLKSRESNGAAEELGINIEDLHSSDFESCSDSEKDDWEEVKNRDNTIPHKPEVSKDGLQITVEMPGVMKKKKGTDLLAAMKRRLNRIRKEHQVLVHKVHLLCWIAHGNYVNSILGGESTLSQSLSLLPNDKCFPSNRIDLKYLEQILKWYRNAVKLNESSTGTEKDLPTSLINQIEKRDVNSKKMWVYVFISVLRAIGIHCRLVLSFQVEPLRPPASTLCSLSTKNDENSKSGGKAKKSDPKKIQLSKAMAGTPPRVPTTPMKLPLSSKVDVAKSIITKQKESKTRKSSKLSQSDKITKSASKFEQIEDDTKQTKDKEVKRVTRAMTQPTDDKFKPGTDEEPKSQKSRTNEIQNPPKVTKPEDTKCQKTRSKSSNENLKPPKTTKSENPDGTSGTNENQKPPKSEEQKTRSKSSNENLKPLKATKSRSKSSSPAAKAPKKKDLIKIKLPAVNLIKTRSKKKIPQVDGTNDSDSEDDDVFLPQLDGANNTEPSTSSHTTKPNLKKLRESVKNIRCSARNHSKPSTSKSIKYKDSDSEDDFIDTPTRRPYGSKNFDSPCSSSSAKRNSVTFSSPLVQKSPLSVKDDIVKLIKGRIEDERKKDLMKIVKGKRKSVKKNDNDSDYEAAEPVNKKPHTSDDEFMPKTKVKRRINPKAISSDEDGKKKKSSPKKAKGCDCWAEVFLENEEKWISVDVINGRIHCVNEIFKHATSPVSYIVAWSNDNSLKDITARYCQNFNTITRKLRADAKWWQESLKPFLGTKTARDREEDDELERQQLEKPLPKSIAEYKNHPLYVLKRHLLKFEGIYPPDAPTLGFVRNEPVYSRQCVYTMHSRDIWLKHAKTVKLGETPYKIVKSRPKYDKLSNTVITDQLLEIFGPWQTEDYVPPTAENGIVPRNAFGNVELFKACMLPKKTVHLQLPGLNKVAKKLNIDCASAVVGFDFHGGWSHPTFDGFVVCEEFRDTLIEAWEKDQLEMEIRENEKMEKRIYGNWKKLIRGLLIRERLKAKYDFGEPSGVESKKKKSKGPKLGTKKRRTPSSTKSDSD